MGEKQFPKHDAFHLMASPSDGERLMGCAARIAELRNELFDRMVAGPHALYRHGAVVVPPAELRRCSRHAEMQRMRALGEACGVLMQALYKAKLPPHGFRVLPNDTWELQSMLGTELNEFDRLANALFAERMMVKA